MSDELTAKIEELKRLNERRTQGQICYGPEAGYIALSVFLPGAGWLDYLASGEQGGMVNAEYVTKAANLAPALIEAIEQAQTDALNLLDENRRLTVQAARLRGALEEIDDAGSHLRYEPGNEEDLLCAIAELGTSAHEALTARAALEAK